MTQEALKLAIQLRDTASGYWTEHEIPIIEKLIELLAKPEQETVGYWKEHAQGMQRDYDSLLADYKKLAQQEQEPVAMRMPKVGDKVVCIEDDSLGVVAYLTAGGSPEIMFDDGSHGTYLLREFAELFRYTTPQSTWQGLTDEHPLMVFAKECVLGAYQETELADAAKRAIEQARGIKE